MNKHTLLITIILALVLVSGCNTENDGIFMRISKSETKTDVGTITLIAKSGSKFYTKTREHQLQVYESNPATKGWTLLSTQATFVATDTTNIYFAPSVTKDENNPISQYVIDSSPVAITPKYADTYDVVAMSPTADLMVVKDSTDKFDVYNVSNEASVVSDLSFYETNPPQLIVQQEDTHFIISGKSSATEYTHYLYDGSTLLATITGINAPVVAFHNDGTNIVLLASSSEIWQGTVAGGYVFTKKGTVPSFSAGNPSHMPYPVFFHGTKLYLQDNNNYMRSIDLPTGTVAEEKTIDLSAVKVWSYLVDSGKVYVGTTQNGIFEINMTTNKVTSL
ncbi:MAG: hypothetical protein PHR10_03210 [Sphaerochaetaceae bacterium]|nr:hypothetical protein [Sphaerochaetaceae bacterium]